MSGDLNIMFFVRPGHFHIIIFELYSIPITFYRNFVPFSVNFKCRIVQHDYQLLLINVQVIQQTVEELTPLSIMVLLYN